MNTRRHHLTRTTISIAFGAYFIPAIGQSRSKNNLLPLPTDLQAAASLATRDGQPLVLMVSLPGCPWCELLRRNYLTPLRAEGLPAFEFMIHDRSSAMRDFQGKSSTPEQLARLWKVTNTPTVFFFGRGGNEIAPRIEGVASADFIGAVIDERIAIAREHIKVSR
jgi:thioredoxin-related protein